MIHFDIVQRTPEWYAIRKGKVTASRISDVLSNGKGGAESTGVRNYRAELAAERLGGSPDEGGYVSYDMQRGIEQEDSARACYEFITGNNVVQVGFVTHDLIDQAGSSPDGLVGDDGGIEIKCHKAAIHQGLLLGEDQIDGKYIKQIQFNMACSGRQWWDYVSYCPEMPEHLQLWVQRIYRDDSMIQDMEQKIMVFLASVDQRVKDLEALCNG